MGRTNERIFLKKYIQKGMLWYLFTFLVRDSVKKGSNYNIFWETVKDVGCYKHSIATVGHFKKFIKCLFIKYFNNSIPKTISELRQNNKRQKGWGFALLILREKNAL